jgi:hypothetical protein
MEYDKGMLKSWAEMETWDQHLERNGGLNRHSSKEGFSHLQKEYFALVENRIDNCKKLLRQHEDAFLYYTLAELYDRVDLNRSPASLFKRTTRYYARKSLEFDASFSPARKLLEKANEWVEFLGGDDDQMPDFDVGFKDNIGQKEF